MRIRIMPYDSAALTAAGLIGWGLGQLASRRVASAAQLTSSVFSTQVATAQASAPTPSTKTPCPAHSSTSSS